MPNAVFQFGVGGNAQTPLAGLTIGLTQASTARDPWCWSAKLRFDKIINSWRRVYTIHQTFVNSFAFLDHDPVARFERACLCRDLIS